MATTMSQDELAAFKEKLSELVEKGTEQEVREYVEYYYSRLPEDVRQELLFDVLADAVKEEAEENAAITSLQEEGLEAAETLEKMRADVEKDEKEGLTE